MLRNNSSYDSAVTVSCYNMWSPLRTRKIGKDGLLRPFVPFETFGDQGRSTVTGIPRPTGGRVVCGYGCFYCTTAMFAESR